MSEMRNILSLWQLTREERGVPLLATVVRVLGSSYRKPGARMLLASAGRRAGTISGGCLEAEVAKKAWWLTESGAVLQRYSSFFDEDGSEPFGLGCGGTVDILLERGAPAAAMLEALTTARSRQEACVAVHVLEGGSAAALGLRLILRADGSVAWTASAADAALTQLADRILAGGISEWHQLELNGAACEVFVEFVPPPVELLIFGAGDDVLPLVAFGHSLDWIVTVSDGRSHLARSDRFPLADRVVVTDLEQPLYDLRVNRNTAAVLMTHSYQQDRAALGALLAKELGFLGVLGPRRRTGRLIGEVAATAALSEEACWARIHSPVGLDVGADTPGSIALAIAAEMLAALRDRSGIPLRLKAANATESAGEVAAR